LKEVSARSAAGTTRSMGRRVGSPEIGQRSEKTPGGRFPTAGLDRGLVGHVEAGTNSAGGLPLGRWLIDFLSLPSGRPVDDGRAAHSAAKSRRLQAGRSPPRWGAGYGRPLPLRGFDPRWRFPFDRGLFGRWAVWPPGRGFNIGRRWLSPRATVVPADTSGSGLVNVGTANGNWAPGLGFETRRPSGECRLDARP